MKKKRLDYLLIPNSSGKRKKNRINRAVEETGKRGIKNILLLDGKDSEEDILYLGKILKNKERIGFVTFPLHYKEYKIIIKKARRDGIFPKKIKIENIKTKQTEKDKIYGEIGILEEQIKQRKLTYRKERNEKIWQMIKWPIKKLLS